MNIARLVRTAPGYFMVAVACVVLNNSLLIGLDWAGFHYVASSVIAAAIIIPFSYALHCRVSYNKNPQKSTFLNYAALQSLNIPATIALLFVLHDLGRLPMAASAILLTIIMALYNCIGSFLVIDANHQLVSLKGKK